MFIGLRRNKAQTLPEYALLFAIVIGAILTMQIYVRRGLQGRIRDAVDYTGLDGSEVLGNTSFAFTGEQYEPYYSASEAASKSRSIQQKVTGTAGETGRQLAQTSRQTRESVLGWGSETATAQAVDDVDNPLTILPGLPNVNRENR